MTTEVLTEDRWYSVDEGRVIEDFGSENGLSAAEAIRRLESHGPNENRA